MTISVYSYNVKYGEWGKLPSPPCKDYGLVCIKGQVTTVGGMQLGSFQSSKLTGQLFSLQDGKWKERYPPLNIERTFPAVVSASYDSCDYVIVVGGMRGSGSGNWITSVEIFSNNKWHHRTDLPECLPYPSVTVTNTTLYVITKYYHIGYSISLRDLLVDSREIRSQNSPLTLPWARLPRLPLCLTTSVSVCGELLIVGGQDNHVRNSFAVYQLWNNQFVEVGRMFKARRQCLVVTPSPYKMVVVGGYCQFGVTQTVEEFSVV